MRRPYLSVKNPAKSERSIFGSESRAKNSVYWVLERFRFSSNWFCNGIGLSSQNDLLDKKHSKNTGKYKQCKT